MRRLFVKATGIGHGKIQEACFTHGVKLSLVWTVASGTEQQKLWSSCICCLASPHWRLSARTELPVLEPF